jgi:hypothetical protein
MDVKYPLLIVATADKKISIFHLDNPTKPYRVCSSARGRTAARPQYSATEVSPPASQSSSCPPCAALSLATSPDAPVSRLQVLQSPLKLNTRFVRAFHNRQTFAVGSAEGRIGVRYVEESMDTA